MEASAVMTKLVMRLIVPPSICNTLIEWNRQLGALRTAVSRKSRLAIRGGGKQPEKRDHRGSARRSEKRGYGGASRIPLNPRRHAPSPRPHVTGEQ